MLKNIPKILSPDLIKILMEMGHGDEIAIVDANFPATNYAKRLIRCDGIGGENILKAILKLFPLDSYSENQVTLMNVVKGDTYKPTIWASYKNILEKSGNDCSIEYMDRYDFYERTKDAFAIIATGEEALYANIILKKGIII